MIRVALAAIITAAFMSPVAAAQALPPIFVFPREDDDSARLCQVSNSSAVDAVKAALRYNGIQVASQADYRADKAVGATVTLGAVESSVGSNTIGCAVSYRLSLDNFQEIFDVVTQKRFNTTVVFCSRSGIAIGVRAGMQTRINDLLREAADECVSDYEDLLRK